MGHEVQQTRWDRVLRRVSASIGPGSRVSETLTELFPVFDVENLPAELLILGGTDICAGRTELIGAAGELANIQLFNPPDSGKIITVTSFIAGVVVDQTITWGTGVVGLGTLVNSQLFRDSRRPFNSMPVGQIRRQSLAGAPVAFGEARLLTDTAFHFQDENAVAVLSPGFGLAIAPIVLASLLEVTFYWRERVAEQSELSL